MSPTVKDQEPAMPPLQPAEIDRRLAITEWAECRSALRNAELDLAVAANTKFRGPHQNTEQLLADYKEAKEEFEAAEKGLASGKPSAPQGKDQKKAKAEREQQEQFLKDDHAKGPQRERERTTSPREIQQRQQDFEKERNRRESEQAGREMDKAGAPGLPLPEGQGTQQGQRQSPAIPQQSPPIREIQKSPSPAPPLARTDTKSQEPVRTEGEKKERP